MNINIFVSCNIFRFIGTWKCLYKYCQFPWSVNMHLNNLIYAVIIMFDSTNIKLCSSGQLKLHWVHFFIVTLYALVVRYHVRYTASCQYKTSRARKKSASRCVCLEPWTAAWEAESGESIFVDAVYMLFQVPLGIYHLQADAQQERRTASGLTAGETHSRRTHSRRDAQQKRCICSDFR